MNQGPTRRGTDPRTLFIDKIANWCISIGGMMIIAAVLGIFVFIFSTILPLIQGSHGSLKGSYPLQEGAPLRLTLVDEHREKALLLREDGRVTVLGLQGQGAVELPGAAAAAQAGIHSSWLSLSGGKLALGLENGSVLLAEAGFETRFDEDQQRH
jgi:phosphate transport system permease protein